MIGVGVGHGDFDSLSRMEVGQRRLQSPDRQLSMLHRNVHDGAPHTSSAATASPTPPAATVPVLGDVDDAWEAYFLAVRACARMSCPTLRLPMPSTGALRAHYRLDKDSLTGSCVSV